MWSYIVSSQWTKFHQPVAKPKLRSLTLIKPMKLALRATLLIKPEEKGNARMHVHVNHDARMHVHVNHDARVHVYLS
jgi:hypothetical protein